ncbi:hypothetical protein SEA_AUSTINTATIOUS_46 [Streptomyces phage Austintatious]|uniref:Uncharacterized protein n=1 Tax=Streptomyces phage Austintatious TaxID=2500795 RepID=A0A411AXH4_9CAUD|nr:hypothetical protein HOV10_gp46 [Streptomyces phage Austintatious]QAX92807.1 hypothetical protein SEA_AUSTINTATIOUS_46 [Streptomyces phage Austintatious]
MTRRRTMAVRKKHAETRLARRIKFEILLDRADRLSPTEADALREYALAEAATADQLRSTARGQDRTLQKMRDRLAAADAAIVEAEQDRARVEEQLAEARHRIDLLHAVDAGRADGAQRITDQRDRAEAFLARLHRAETYGDVLAILGEHRGLTPVAARAAAAFAAAADSQAAVLAERDREHAVALATEKQRTERAEALLDRVRAARTWGDLWAHLGMRYGYTAEQAGREARDRRTAAERAADARAEEAAAALSREAGELLDVRQQLTSARKHAGALTVSLARTAKHARKNEQRLADARRRLAAECVTCGCPREQHASRLYANARARLDELLDAAGRAANQLGTAHPADIADRLYAAIEQARKDPS